MSDSAAEQQTPDRDADADEHDKPLAETAQSPERVDHVDVTQHDEVDQAALDIAESTSSDEPPA